MRRGLGSAHSREEWGLLGFLPSLKLRKAWKQCAKPIYIFLPYLLECYYMFAFFSESLCLEHLQCNYVKSKLQRCVLSSSGETNIRPRCEVDARDFEQEWDDLWMNDVPVRESLQLSTMLKCSICYTPTVLLSFFSSCEPRIAKETQGKASKSRSSPRLESSEEAETLWECRRARQRARHAPVIPAFGTRIVVELWITSRFLVRLKIQEPSCLLYAEEIR